MGIPKVMGKNGKQYIYVQEYPRFILYKDMMTGVKECFLYQELGLISETNVMEGFKLNPEKLKYIGGTNE